MRILFWSETFYPNIGGVEVLGVELVRALHARGHEIVLVAGPYQRQESEPQLFDGIPIYRFPFEYQTHPYTVEMIGRIKQQLTALRQSFRADILHFYQIHQSLVFHLANPKSVQPDGWAEPTLLTLHGNIFDGTPQTNQLRRHFCRQVSWITACSRARLNETRAFVPEITTSSSVIYNALATPACEPTPLDFDTPRILYVGRLHPEKRADIAIDAFARVHSRFPRARLLLAGDGIEEAALRAQVEQLGLQDVVDFLGWVQPQAIPDLINQMTVVLVPSRFESFGLAALQGGQMARPVIATRVGGLPEVIMDGETGILVEPENAEAMADALVSLLAQPDRARAMGVAARRHVEQKFGWSTFLDKYETLYAQLIEQARVGV